MSLSCVNIDRFSVGGFGDLRLQKRGPVPSGAGCASGLLHSGTWWRAATWRDWVWPFPAQTGGDCSCFK